MAKSLSELRKMQRDQLKSVTKEDLTESILSSPKPEGLLHSLTAKLNALVSEAADLKKKRLYISRECG